MPDSRRYYVFCGDDCRFESMTKEQILAAITQAVESHTIADVDTGFVTKLKEMNANTALQTWVGSQAEYNALSTYDANTLYLIWDDTTEDDIIAAIESRDEIIADMQTAINSAVATLGSVPQLGKVLYEGSISQGRDLSVTIAGLSAYKAVIVYVGMAAIVCTKSTSGATFCGGAVTGIVSDGALTQCSIRLAVTGDIITSYSSNTLLTAATGSSTPASMYLSTNAYTITKIVGLM